MKKGKFLFELYLSYFAATAVVFFLLEWVRPNYSGNGSGGGTFYNAIFLLLTAGAAALVAAVPSYFSYVRLSRPLDEIRKGAERVTLGDLAFRFQMPGTDDVGALANAFNEMSDQLDIGMKTVIRQRNELGAILSSMAEGVLVINPGKSVVRLNEAAARLLNLTPEQVDGGSVRDIVRNGDLRSFIYEALRQVSGLEKVVSVYEPQELHLQVYARHLAPAEGDSETLLVVLNDITRLRKLERIRSDFVANVSHELKTPITSIKGFVETLLDGALDDRVTAERFLAIIAKQADRLNSIFEDLLSLSRLEQDRSGASIHVRRGKLLEVIDTAVQLCQIKAAEKQISLEVECAETLELSMNQNLLEQAIVNLIDNSIKYSEPGCTVTIRVEELEQSVSVQVLDSGCGIERRHLTRLFERFYRVDQARSRKQGGTGLGLAIVKHIANLHGGKASVQSEVGKGSVFSIELPKIGKDLGS